MVLLPCPFCGEHLVEKSDNYLTWFAHADEETNCLMRLVNLFDADDQARWNTRALIAGRDLRSALSPETEQALIASYFGEDGKLAGLSPAVQEALRRREDEAYRAGWQAGFTEGTGKAATATPESSVRVSLPPEAPMRIDGYGVGDQVEVAGGDHTFAGTVVAAFPKLWGAARFVVEDDRGVLHIYRVKNFRSVGDAAARDGDSSAEAPRAEEAERSRQG